MKAVVMTKAGSPEVLELQEVPTSQIKSPTDISIILLNQQRCYNLKNQIGVNHD